MHFASTHRALIALGALSLAACQQDVSGPSSGMSAESAPRSLSESSVSSQLVMYDFQNATTNSTAAAPTSFNSAIVTATPATIVLGSGVANLAGHVVDFGGDKIFNFASGVYQYVSPSNYTAFQVGLASTVAAGCQVNLSQARFELEHNVVNGYQPIAGVVERRNASGVLLATYPITIPFGFAVNNPPHYITVNLTGVTLGSQTTFFRFRMNSSVFGTSSGYTAGLYLDDVSFDGSVYCVPTAQITAPATSVEGQAVPIAVTTNYATTIAWNLGDGTVGTGPVPATHVYADNGTYVITVTLDGASTPAASHTITVSNAAPVVSAFAGATILVGETYTASGTFSDAGVADTHTATVSWGGAAQPLALAGGAFSLSHQYTTAGIYTVTVSVTDDDGATGTKTATVTVLSPAQGAQQLIGSVSTLTSAGSIASTDAKVLTGMVQSAQAAIERGNTQAALGKLGAFDNKVGALENSGRITTATATTLTTASGGIQKSLSF